MQHLPTGQLHLPHLEFWLIGMDKLTVRDTGTMAYQVTSE